MGAFSERGDHVIPVSGKGSILLVELARMSFSVTCSSYSDRPTYVPTQKNRYIACFAAYQGFFLNRQIRICFSTNYPAFTPFSPDLTLVVQYAITGINQLDH